MLFQSIEWLLSLHPIYYNQAIALAFAGLLVNVACAWLLKNGHGHSHDHHDHTDQGHHHQDLNLPSAYVRVVADAATSVLLPSR